MEVYRCSSLNDGSCLEQTSVDRTGRGESKSFSQLSQDIMRCVQSPSLLQTDEHLLVDATFV
jgi:hypothetical protein